MDEPADTPPAATPKGGPSRQRLSADGIAGALGRAAPVLRQVIGDSAADEVREAVVLRAGALVDRAHDAVARFTAIEGSVVDGEDGAPSMPADAAAAGATPPPPGRAAAPASTTAAAGPTGGPAAGSTAGQTAPPGTTGARRDPHWNRQRLARMAAAAGREALRPAPRASARSPLLLAGLGAVIAVLLALRLRRR